MNPVSTVIHTLGAEGLCTPFEGSGTTIQSPEFEKFEDGELGTRVPVSYIRDHRVLVVGESTTARGVLGAYDLACAAQQYGALHVGVVFPKQTHAADEEQPSNADRAFDRLMGHIFSSWPRAPFGNTYFSFDPVREQLFHQSLRPSPDSKPARRHRDELQYLVGTSLNVKRTLRAQEHNGDPWLVTPATRTGLKCSVVDDAFEPVRTEPMLLSIKSYEYLRDEVANHGYAVGQVTYETTSFGLVMPFAPKEVLGREVLIVAGTPSDEDFLELAALICSAVERGASLVTVAIPYMGCARMDRAVKEGDVVTAKTRARLLSFLPQAPFLNTFIFFDLHTFGVQHYFEGPARRSHYYLEKVMNAAIAAELGGALDFIVSPDVGHAKWTRAYARAHGIDEAVIDKVRVSGSLTQGFRILVGADIIAGRVGMVHDDLTCTCGTAVGAGKECRKRDPKDLYLGLSHGVFSPGAVEFLKASGVFARGFVSNSHPRAHEACLQFPDLLREVSVAPVIDEAYRRGAVRA